MEALSGKHALVTGGGTGVGASIALALAAAGASVTITGRREQPLADLASRHDAIDWLTCDVTDPDSTAAVCQQAAERHGPVSIAIANAGAAASKPFARMSAADLHKLLDVNLIGVFNTWQACLSPMIDAGWGRLVAIGSVAGLKGYPYISGYCAAKHAVTGMTRALALELATTGITVNAICPGYVDTPMLDRTLDNIEQKTGLSRQAAADKIKSLNPQQRFIQPDEVAHSVIWLCSQHAGSINGQAIAIAGGEA